jgi:hypothetical protein
MPGIEVLQEKWTGLQTPLQFGIALLDYWCFERAQGRA